jgi:hypothetical protein
MSNEKDGKLGRQQLVYNAPLPKFLQAHIAKGGAGGAGGVSEEEKEKRMAEMKDRPEMEDEAPLIVADELLQKELEIQQAHLKEVQKRVDEERRANEDARLRKALVDQVRDDYLVIYKCRLLTGCCLNWLQSKFGTTEQTAHVFRKKESATTTKEDPSKSNNKKRKVRWLVPLGGR